MPLYTPLPRDVLRILGQSHTPVSLTGSTTETIMATVPVKGLCLGAHGGIRVTHFWSYPTSANNKLPRLRLGGLAGVIFGAPVLTTTVQAHMVHTIRNAGALNAQEFFIPSSTTGFSASATALSAAGAIDTSVDQDLVITGQLALGSETLILRSYSVELLRP